MSLICPCGQPATHRMNWNRFTETVEPTRSKRPTRCYACAMREAPALNAQRRAEDDHAQTFDAETVHAYRSDVPLPHLWHAVARKVVLKHGASINPGGLVKTHREDNYLVVELYPPKEKPATWSPEACLYSLRYLMRRPVVFVPVPVDERLSPRTWRAAVARSAKHAPSLLADQ